MRGVGLEPNATVMVFRPELGNAWVNVGYAGFIGSVTAMNEKGIAIGEMGGGGQGAWDGKPMAQLVREVMERASTLDDAVRIMRESRRTCEYYYVISDGKSRQAVAIAATPDKFEVLHAGEANPRLPQAITDAVLLSAGGRYEELVRRVRDAHGKLDVSAIWNLMKPPVCMDSNLHTVLFSPETLDFWVANADPLRVAANGRWVHYNLKALLASP
jgi:isopenicillin-N N-acyltransferase like protein